MPIEDEFDCKGTDVRHIEGLTSHSNHDIVKVAKAYINNNRNRVEVTRKVPMDGKLLLDEGLMLYCVWQDIRDVSLHPLSENIRHSFPENGNGCLFLLC